ncbi:hypothetical protein N7541_003674 [Penicillium brevicompactum]|uniref:Chromo domain-containing protein n=1 Tax=Penicillium brevicompactum TaxID=5074 RepID=A0A9W9V1B1_PENBR|nr:hypothetical protein N7541_003674 [Penicillium brevicompactum]
MPITDILHQQHTDRPVAFTLNLSDSSHSSDISTLQEWPIKRILRETATEYLIDWEGPYDPTWEPKENASELAIQIWNKRKARNARELDREATHETRYTESLHSSLPITISSSAKTNGDSEDGSSISLKVDLDQGDISWCNSPSPAHQDSILEIPESPQFQYLEVSSRFAETSSQLQSYSGCSQHLPAAPTSSGRQTDSSVLEYVPESSIASKLLRGERQRGVEFETLQSSNSHSCASLETNHFDSSQILAGSFHHQQSLEDNHNVRGFVQPKVTALVPRPQVYEIPETPDQPQLSGTSLSHIGSPASQHTSSQHLISVPSQPTASPWPVSEGPVHVRLSHWSSIPETLPGTPSQQSHSLSAEAFIKPMLPLSSLMEPNPPANMDRKEKKPFISSPYATQSDQQGNSSDPSSKEKIRNDWAQLGMEHRTGTPLAGNAIDTPSSVGDIEATMSAPIPETTASLSVRNDTGSFAHSHTAVQHGHSEPLLTSSELAHGGHISQQSMQTIQPSALTVGGMEEIAPGSVQLGPSEFAVTLPMDSRVKDDYERVLSDAATNIRQFFCSFQPNSQISNTDRDELYSSMRNVITRLNNVALHPDLNISDHLKGVEPDLTKEASWAEYSSAKFLFLGHLMELVGTNELHLIVVVGDEKKQLILERYLQGKGFAYTRPREEMGSAVEVSLARGPLSFGIHSSESARELLKTPSAILALDSSYGSRSPSMQHIRTTYAQNGHLLPVIWFLIANTSEHIQRCLPDLPEIERLHLLVHYIARLHDEVGDLQDNALGVQEDAEEILAFLLDRASGWQLPTIEPLNLVSLEELEVSNDSSSDDTPPHAPKRALDEGSEDNSSKRARVGTQEDSQLTESSKPSSQTLDRDLRSLEKVLVQTKGIHATEKRELQTELAQSNSRCRELEKQMGLLQHRYESRTGNFHKIRQERDDLVASKSTNEERVQKQTTIINKLKEERTELKSQLEESRKALKDGGGTPAEMETLREEIRRLVSENENLVHKANYEKGQSEYTREQYQTASTAAAQSGTESRRLAAENEALKRRVEGDVVKLHEINAKKASDQHAAEIEKLRLTITQRDEFLRKKEDELREIRKNRPSTRSTSTQPRSPKWGAGSRPTSPGVGHNGNGNGNGGVAGRGSGLRYSSEMRL